MDILVVLLSPIVSLVNYFVHGIDLRTNNENYCLIIWLEHVLLRQYHLLLDFGSIWKLTNNKRKYFQNIFIHIQRFVPGLFVEILVELSLVVLLEKAEVNLIRRRNYCRGR